MANLVRGVHIFLDHAEKAGQEHDAELARIRDQREKAGDATVPTPLLNAINALDDEHYFELEVKVLGLLGEQRKEEAKALKKRS